MCIRSGKCIFLNITASLLLGLNQAAITGQDIICGGNNINVMELYEIALNWLSSHEITCRFGSWGQQYFWMSAAFSGFYY